MLNFDRDSIEELADNILLNKDTLTGILEYKIKGNDNKNIVVEAEYSYSANNKNHFYFIRVNNE